MKTIRRIIISSVLLFSVAGCASSGNDFLATLWDDISAPILAGGEHAPRLALTIDQGAAPADERTADGIIIEVNFRELGFLENIDQFSHHL